MRDIESWLSIDELKNIYTSSYWNDIEEEKKKEWWINDGNYEKCLNYLRTSKLLDEYKYSEKFIVNHKNHSIKVADLAAGIGWTSALISKNKNVNEVHAVEISNHRIDSLFENAVKMLNGDSSKIFRYIGNFYELKFETESIDLIYMSQAFHHADKPLKLLHECDRVLKNDGRIILVGEHFIGFYKIIRKFFANLLKRRVIATNFYEMFPPDKTLGDHYYRKSDYQFMFQSLGYEIESFFPYTKDKLIYVADKKTK